MEPGKPDAGKPPVRFDEGWESDGHWFMPFNPSAPAYSTHFSPSPANPGDGADASRGNGRSLVRRGAWRRYLTAPQSNVAEVGSVHFPRLGERLERTLADDPGHCDHPVCVYHAWHHGVECFGEDGDIGARFGGPVSDVFDEAWDLADFDSGDLGGGWRGGFEDEARSGGRECGQCERDCDGCGDLLCLRVVDPELLRCHGFPCSPGMGREPNVCE